MTFDISLGQILMRALAMLVLTGLHGFALAGIARLFGDKGPGYDGRLTPNPFNHVAVLGVLAGIFTLWGWIRPMRIDAAELKGRRLGLVATVLLSLTSVVVVCLLLRLLREPAVTMLNPALSNQVTAWLQLLAEASIVFAIVNLLPLPPFTGMHLLAAIAPKLAEAAEARAALIGIALVVLAIIDRGQITAFLLRGLVNALAPT